MGSDDEGGDPVKIAITFNEKRTSDETHAEFDSRDSIAVIARMVAGLGHTVVPIDVTGSVGRLIAELERVAPDLVFNFAEGERGAFREAFYPALFEQLGIPHTGSSASALSVCMDKALAKRVVAGARVRVPRGQLVRSAREIVTPPAWPVIVKPNLEGSSKGITADSVIRDPARLAGAVGAALARYPGGVLVEEMIAGVDVGVGWVEGVGLLPPIAYHCGDDPHAIYDFALKHAHPELVDVRIPAPLSELVSARLAAAAQRAFTALGVEGYGRVDFRITPEGEVVFLEMNPLPSLTLAAGHDELYVAAAARGFSPRELLAAILEVEVGSGPDCRATPSPRTASG
jgi:D-alanine-D-alanine ligase